MGPWSNRLVHTPTDVNGDRVQLEQVILNLVVNACDAMRDESTGPHYLTLSTSPGEGDTVEVGVKDTGVGVPADEVDQLLKPFYSTKADGMGMGLSICQTIIESHRGRLWATSNPDRGTAFHFTLPMGD